MLFHHRVWSRFSVLAGVCALVLIALYILSSEMALSRIVVATERTTNVNLPINVPPPPESQPDSIVGRPNVAITKATPSHDFWHKVFTLFEQNKFAVEESAEPIEYIKTGFTRPGVSNSKDILMAKANFNQDTFEDIQERHSEVIKGLPDNLGPTYKKDSKGIVLIGGGWYSWLSYLALVSIRDTGSKLPVEFILPKFQDYEVEYDFCNQVLPKLGASCVIVADRLGTAVTRKWEFGSYQYKALAIVSSSFQHVILLDSDNILLQNPDSIFDSKVYRKYGLITWPDYWKRTISPYFYSIAKIKVDEQKRVRYDRFPFINPVEVSSSELHDIPYHDLDGTVPDLSTESGQLLVDKNVHGQTLLLALYYNVFGYGYYYKLLSLGSLGEGDKDTFVTAAVVLSKPNYQVKSHIRTYGFMETKGFRGIGMGQKDPVEDYQLFRSEMRNLSRVYKKQDLSMKEQIHLLKRLEDHVFKPANSVPLFALHCNVLKINPVEFMEEEEIYDKEKHRIKKRMYDGLTYSVGADQNIDFEFRRWTFVKKILCEDKIQFSTYKDANFNKMCSFINNTVTWLKTAPLLSSEIDLFPGNDAF